MSEQPEGSATDQNTTSDAWMTWHHQFFALKITRTPPKETLEQFLQTSIPVKIPLPKSDFDNVFSQIKDRDLMNSLFEPIETDVYCRDFVQLIVARIIEPETTGTTETAHISYWDTMIRNVFDYVFVNIPQPSAIKTVKSDRDTVTSDTGIHRPDFVLTVNDSPVFREEKSEFSSHGMKEPIEELRSKMKWSHSPLPYIFGYAAKGSSIRLLSLSSDTGDNDGNVVLTQIGVRARTRLEPDQAAEGSIKYVPSV